MSRQIDVLEHSNDYSSYYSFAEDDSLSHYQVFGAKHGVRRWQNKDGSLTPAGRIHYGVGQPRKVGLVEKVRNAGIKKIAGEAKLQKQLDYERKSRARKDVEKVLNRDLSQRPLGSKADINNFKLDQSERGTRTAIDNLIKEMAKEDLNKVINQDYLRGKGMPVNLAAIIDEKVMDEKYRDYKDYLDSKYGENKKSFLQKLGESIASKDTLKITKKLPTN